MNWNIEAIKQANRDKGFHYFEPGAMRFFNSRVLSQVFEGQGGVFFVTSEKFVGSVESKPRKFTVREFNPETADIKTHGEFNQLSRTRTLTVARRAAQSPAQGGAL